MREVAAGSRHVVTAAAQSGPPRLHHRTYAGPLLLSFEGFGPSEIAKLLELEAGTVRAHLMRARRCCAR
ncbi:sigma factor-like helix-turn-helix DNA-binding protein [Streptomyces sp. NPDC055078]